MKRVIVVGSGASGVHFALSALRKGHAVTVLDVGRGRPPAVLGDAGFTELKQRLPDPARYFLGEEYEAVLFPGADHEYYGFPPSKTYVFSPEARLRVEARGFAPLFSFAQGGLAEAWTAGCYPLTAEELQSFPFRYDELAPHYEEVARRIGVTGAKDDLSRFFPLQENLLQPLRLDSHSELLLAAYERDKEYFAGRLRCFMGRSRVAVLSADAGGRKACTYTGRCLWGCPSGALYTPSLTLEECRRYPEFTYLSGHYVTHLNVDTARRVMGVSAEPVGGGPSRSVGGDAVVLAAGTLCSTQIYARSVQEATGEIPTLRGLMDNRQVLVPFVTLRRIGVPYEPTSYQYHQLALGIEGATAADYVHAQITTLKTALAHPIIQNVPADLRTATFLFRNVRGGLGLVNVNFADHRRETNFVTLRPGATREPPTLIIAYEPDPDEPARIARAVRTVRRALWRLGAIVPPGMSHVRPMGASVHYAGTLPMSTARGTHTLSRMGSSNFFENLYIVDGSGFPSLPAKNLTFTLMANAVRVAHEAF
jgi:choline dehydrogenase-like flavoprotein